MDERFLREEGTEVFTGNELILKGALESGCALITGYPGSPVSDIFDGAYANREILKKRGILAEMANNEALAAARLNGSRMAGVRAMAVMKSVGLHVASDGLALGNLSEPQNKGGSLVVVGDDPWIDSTQINNDSRFLSQHLHMPVMEPATFQEMKDWVGLAFDLSRAANLYITYLVTTNQADGGGTVWLHPNQWPETNELHPVTLDTSRINLDTQVLLPPRTWSREATLPHRFETLLAEAHKRKINVLRIPSPPRRGKGLPAVAKAMAGAPAGDLAEAGAGEEGKFPIGFISSGLSYCYLEHALNECGLSNRFPILKLGLTYPVEPRDVLALAEQVKAIYVIEEKRGFMESQILQILNDERQSPPHPVAAAANAPACRQAGSPTRGEGIKVWGKKFPKSLAGIPEARGLNTSVLMDRLIPLFLQEMPDLTDGERARLNAEREILEATEKVDVKLPFRTPTFCPGCPHRDSSSVFLQIKKDFGDPAYMSRVHKREPLDLVFHGETGCFTMLMFEPNESLMHNYSGMGLGGGTGAGADPFITNKQIVFLGDSTFFHSGMISISDSIKSQQDITYVILDNKTTAMTGHQPTPGTDLNLMGDKTFTQSIEAIVQAMAGKNVPVHRVNPAYRDSYRSLLEETVLQDGVKIVIADKECGLTYQRRVRKEKKHLLRLRGYLPEERHVNVTPEVCEYCLECTKVTGCPGLAVEDTLYGPKIVTDLSHCVSDGACAKVKACPSFEEVTVVRRRPTTTVIPAGRRPGSIMDVPSLMDPPPVTAGDDGKKDPWYCFTAGVGGQGAGVVSAVLVLAAHLEGYRVLFSDKKGLAIRNGGVYAHLLVSRAGGVLAPLVPYGKADLILGIDLLEAARSLDPKTNLRVGRDGKTDVVVNTALTPTIRMLMGNDAVNVEGCKTTLQKMARPGGYWGEDLSAYSERTFGSKLYANMMLLGAAYQLGRLPFKAESLESAISRSVSSDERTTNLKAFLAGRTWAAQPASVPPAKAAPRYAELLNEKIQYLKASDGGMVAEKYRLMVEEAVLELDGDETLHRDFALRVYDLFHYDGFAYARRYADLVLSTARKDRREWKLQATRAVVHNAFKVMAIKDEVFVAHLLTSPEKRERDRARYQIDASRGDRLRYRHFNRPEFVIFGKRVSWDMETRDWQLQIMKRLRFLRRLLPGWHREEREFREWYMNLAAHFDAETEKIYATWVRILSSPETVRGYREIRAPAMLEARRQVTGWIDELSATAEPRLRRRLSVFCFGARR